jgi:hypothetical protein
MFICEIEHFLALDETPLLTKIIAIQPVNLTLYSGQTLSANDLVIIVILAAEWPA